MESEIFRNQLNYGTYPMAYIPTLKNRRTGKSGPTNAIYIGSSVLFACSITATRRNCWKTSEHRRAQLLMREDGWLFCILQAMADVYVWGTRFLSCLSWTPALLETPGRRKGHQALCRWVHLRPRAPASSAKWRKRRNTSRSLTFPSVTRLGSTKKLPKSDKGPLGNIKI